MTPFKAAAPPGDGPPAANRYAALFIDWENIKYSLRERAEDPDVRLLVKAASGFGRLVIARAYADWLDYDHRRSHDPMRLYHAGVEPVYVPARSSPYSQRISNSVDVKMTADCVEASFLQPHIQTFVLVSGDHSLLHLVGPLRARDKTVVVIGVEENTADALAERVDRLLFYHDLMEKPAAAAGPQQPLPTGDLGAFLNALVGLVREQRARGVYPLLTGLGGQVRQRYPEFKATDYGFEKFGDLVRHAADQGLLKIVPEGMRRYILLPDDVLPAGLDRAEDEPGEPDPARAAQGPSPSPGEQAAPDLDTVINTLVDLVRERRLDGKLPLFAWLANSLSAQLPQFRLEDHDFPRFSDLARYAESRGALRIVRRQNGHYIALLPGDDEPPLDPEPVRGPAVPDAAPGVSPFAVDALEKHPEVFARITQVAEELEDTKPYVTARYLAKYLWDRDSRFPATLFEEEPPPPPGEMRALDLEQVVALVNQAVQRGVFRRVPIVRDYGAPIYSIRLVRSDTDVVLGATLSPANGAEEETDDGIAHGPHQDAAPPVVPEIVDAFEAEPSGN
uniref:HTH OST-type domain-containing protein n=1 Tax=uncultured Armatimonadetes bacterium TaxID=157466 RepID=A0A6J4HAD3_9BACT|nr:hypothetical protein AVDCRST_MAG63-221 [uncultured Armatimonadetes bacterium]